MVFSLLETYISRAQSWIDWNVADADMSDGIIKVIDRHYKGGWYAFSDGYAYCR